MGFFFKKKQESRKNGPAMEKELAPDVLGQIWVAVRDDGRKRKDWSIARMPRGEGQLPYRTFAPKHLPAAVFALARLAKGFSSDSAIDSELQSQLAMLAAVLYDVLGDPYGNAEATESAERTSGNGVDREPVAMDL
jgi:hypothetical protein